MSSPIQFLIICPLVFLAGFVDAIAGGGGLISLPAYLIAGLPVHTAIGTNKMSSSMGTAITTWQFWRKGYIRLKLSLICVVFALIGSTCGANLALLVADRIFQIILLFILPLTAVYVFLRKDMDSAGKAPFSLRKTIILCSAIALIIGVYDGFYGPGTGTFLLLLLTGLAHLDLNAAAGTTKAINLATNVAALVTYLINGKVLLLTGLIAGAFGIAGNFLGAHYFTSKGTKIVRPIIIVVLVIFFVRVVYELITGA